MLKQLDCSNLSVELVPAEEAELDEMWSFVKNKGNQRWLGHAIDHASGKVLAYVFGARKDKIFSQLKALLMPFGIKHFYTDDWAAYQRKIPGSQHTISKTNTQQIERKHLTFRVRIKRLARNTNFIIGESIEPLVDRNQLTIESFVVIYRNLY